MPSSEVRFMAVEQKSQVSAGGFTPLSTDVFQGQQKGHPGSKKPPPRRVSVELSRGGLPDSSWERECRLQTGEDSAVCVFNDVGSLPRVSSSRRRSH